MSIFDQGTPAIILLATGDVFVGRSCGATGWAVGEVVFNTSMTGYQEILTDPSYCKQMVLFTAPHVGGTGTNEWDNESDGVHLSGVIMRQIIDIPSNWQSSKTLNQFLIDNAVVGIDSIDTRALTTILREKGSQSGCIYNAVDADQPSGLEKARAYLETFPGLVNQNLTHNVTRTKEMHWNQHPHCRGKSQKIVCRVVVIDFGVKRSLLNSLVDVGCDVFVLPADTTEEQILKHQPDGVVLSNGPGDPIACTHAIALTKSLIQKRLPILGICLGHQILALANGLMTTKMPFGHHGSNHPVQELSSGRVIVTSQNHGFAVDESTLHHCPDCQVTHRSLFDHSIQGLSYKAFPGLSFQGHPEGGAGPRDMDAFFEQFIVLMNNSTSC